MIPRINLLPHRERRREQRKKDFLTLRPLPAQPFLTATVAPQYPSAFAQDGSAPQAPESRAFCIVQSSRETCAVHPIKTRRLRVEVCVVAVPESTVVAPAAEPPALERIT